MSGNNLHCSFCSKSATEVKKIIAGTDVFICNECIDKCYKILNDKKTSKISNKTSLPSPREIKNFLDQYVIGQSEAKEILSIAVYNHYKRLDNTSEVEIEKSNILMFGPTGVGKTLLAQTIARFLNVPFTIADATSLTEAGYVGDDVESIITRLYQASENDVKKCERGIVFLDEIDKKRAKGDTGLSSRDVSGEGVQQALLKLFEGADVMVPSTGSKKTNTSEMIKINTKNILFIVAGAFVGLEKIIEKTISKENTSIGFGATIKEKNTNTLHKADSEHFITYGLIPELVGRLPVITCLDELDENQLVEVLTKPKNALIKQYQTLFKIDGMLLEFTEEFLMEIAKMSRKRKTGGRALRSIIEAKLRKVQFALPDLYKSGIRKIVVNSKTIMEDELPEYFYKDQLTESI